jgi:hypothetical protein
MLTRYSLSLAVILNAAVTAAPIDLTTGIITGARIEQASLALSDGANMFSPLVQLVTSRPYTAQIVPTGSDEKNESFVAVAGNRDLGFASSLATGAGALEVGVENGLRFEGFHSGFSRWFTTIKNNTDEGVFFGFFLSMPPAEVTLLGGRNERTAHLRAEAFVDYRLLTPNEDDPGTFDETRGRLFDYFLDFDDLNKSSDFQTHSPNASVLCVNTSLTNRCTSLPFEFTVVTPNIPARGELTLFYDMFAHSDVRRNEKGSRVFLGDPTDLVGGPAGRLVQLPGSDAVPEPASMLLVSGALTAILLARRGRSRKSL